MEDVLGAVMLEKGRGRTHSFMRASSISKTKSRTAPKITEREGEFILSFASGRKGGGEKGMVTGDVPGTGFADWVL